MAFTGITASLLVMMQEGGGYVTLASCSGIPDIYYSHHLAQIFFYFLFIFCTMFKEHFQRCLAPMLAVPRLTVRAFVCAGVVLVIHCQ